MKHNYHYDQASRRPTNKTKDSYPTSNYRGTTYKNDQKTPTSANKLKSLVRQKEDLQRQISETDNRIMDERRRIVNLENEIKTWKSLEVDISNRYSCPVCLDKFLPGEKIRRGRCSCNFHAECFDQLREGKCPRCKKYI